MEQEGKINSAPNNTPKAAVETYAGDMAEVIENNTEGLVKKIIHSEEEHEMEKRNLSPESKKNRIFMLVGILLVVLAVATFSLVFFENTADDTVPVAKQFTPIIFSDQSTYLEVLGLKKDQIAQTVLNEVNATKVKVGGVEGIYLTENKQIVGLRRFISLISSHFVPGDNPLFINDNFLMGVVNSPVSELAGKNFFILLKMRSTADIFSLLRAWEPDMLSDLHGFLGLNVSADTNYLFTKSFTDGIIGNKNARILSDQTGKTVLMYIFADDNSVIITGSQNAAQEIMLRLASGNVPQ